jgi:hypothetical protein
MGVLAVNESTMMRVTTLTGAVCQPIGQRTT